MPQSIKQHWRTEKKLKEFERKFSQLEKFKNKRDTDDSLLKTSNRFFSDKNNNAELNTFFEKFWNMNLKEKQQK